jgi:hypothetical protein
VHSSKQNKFIDVLSSALKDMESDRDVNKMEILLLREN